MKSKYLLRIAAFFIFVHLLGHTVGHITWDRPGDPKMQEIVASMKSYSAEFMGATKSMADYYTGYSLIIFGLFIMTILTLWSASNFINEHKNIAVRILLPVSIAYLFFGVVEFLYFFPFAAGMSFFAGLLIIISILTVK